jgi:hypothetical protein
MKGCGEILDSRRVTGMSKLVVLLDGDSLTPETLLLLR